MKVIEFSQNFQSTASAIETCVFDTCRIHVLNMTKKTGWLTLSNAAVHQCRLSSVNDLRSVIMNIEQVLFATTVSSYHLQIRNS